MHGGLFFDRNVPVKAVRALQVLRDDVVGHAEWFAPAERDDVIVREVAARRFSLLTRDSQMAKRPRERRVLLDCAVHVFINADGGNLGTWDYFVLLVTYFPAIERIITSEPPAIYFYTRSAPPRLRFFLDANGEMRSASRQRS